MRHGLELIPSLERATHAVAVYVQGGSQAGLTQAEGNVLAFLNRYGASSLSDVHAAFGHRRSTLTSVIDRLANRKLVTRGRDPEDGRAFILSLTPAGGTAARAVTVRLGNLEARVAARVTKTDMRSFLKVAHAIHEVAAEDGMALR